ncbi:MAG: dicarboxylate/amino acid:cation symporter [Pirellulaceae bacterium]|jgi:Na+/H+-dicarboxylate symporter|nr:dicarboxylate/amino acid:cation symporter [Pirellulaceae bacterium]MDP7016208.1 dicarboxylate/amino acid:cation symporter [Pirellulaceae bacterium]
MRLALHWQIFLGMIIGAGVGLSLNATVSQRRWSSTSQTKLPPGMTSVTTLDSPDLIEIKIEGDKPRTLVVDGSRKTPDSVATLKLLAASDQDAHDVFFLFGRSPARRVGDLANRLGRLFLRMLQMVSVPLIVTSLLTGVMGLGSASRLKSMFGRTMAYYLTTSLLAICTGLFMVNAIRPGLRGEQSAGQQKPSVGDNLSDVLWGQVNNMIPQNPFNALASTSLLAIICFTIAFGVFALRRGGATADRVRELASAGFDVMMDMTMAIIRLAPLGVLFLMLYVTATQGPDVFRALFWYVLSVFGALVIHALIVLPLILIFVAKRNPIEFARAMSPALVTAFSSASSNGTLPLTMASVEKRAGVDNRVSSFVLPLGATINMDGTALYEAVAVLFIAQLYHGHNLEISQQLIVAFTALLASVGAAGIPHAGLVMMVIILRAVDLPLDMQGIILAVDRVLDMCRTSVNVWSDSCGCAVVARFESAASKAAAT